MKHFSDDTIRIFQDRINALRSEADHLATLIATKPHATVAIETTTEPRRRSWTLSQRKAFSRTMRRVHRQRKAKANDVK